MIRKLLVNVTAIATATAMVIAPTVTVYADESDVTNEQQKVSTLSDEFPDTLVVNQEIVITDGHNAVTAEGEGASITVNHPEGENTAVDQSGTYQMSNGNPTSQAAIIARNNASVEINGDAIGSSTVVSAYSGADVTVNGSLNSTGVVQEIHSTNTKTGETTIFNSVSSKGITTDGTASINVTGNVSAASGPVVLINPTQDGAGGDITIGGTVIASNAYSNGIEIYSLPAADGGVNYSSKEDAMSHLPTVTVYEISTGISVAVNMHGTDQAIVNEVKEEFIKTINYIIHKDEGIEFTESSNISFGSTYNTVNRDKAFTVSANVAPTHYLSAGNNTQVTDNGDGTYTIVLLNSRGGINIRAILRPVPVSTEESSNDTSPEPVQYVVQIQETPAYADPVQAPAGAITVTAPTPAPTPEVAAISGDKPAHTVSLNLGKVTAVQYRETVIQNIASVPASGAFNIETDRVSFFDRNMITALAARPDIDVNVVFSYAGRKIKVTIPAGYDVRTLLDEHGYCGFLRLMAILGGTQIG